MELLLSFCDLVVGLTRVVHQPDTDLLVVCATMTAGPICIDLEDPGLSTETKRMVEEEVLKMLNESYDRTRATLRKYAKQHHMVRKMPSNVAGQPP